LVSARTSGVRPLRRHREQQTVDGDAVHSLLFAAVLTILLHGWFGLSRGLMIDNEQLSLQVTVIDIPAK